MAQARDSALERLICRFLGCGKAKGPVTRALTLKSRRFYLLPRLQPREIKPSVVIVMKGRCTFYVRNVNRRIIGG